MFDPAKVDFLFYLSFGENKKEEKKKKINLKTDYINSSWYKPSPNPVTIEFDIL